MTVAQVLDPTRIDFAPGERKPHPIPPPGNNVDGEPVVDVSALWPGEPQVTTITLATSTLTGDITTLVVTPTQTSTGSAWGEQLGPFTLVFTTGGTQTLAAVAAGLDAAATAAQTPADIADLANYQRVSDVATVIANGDDVVITSAHNGGRFTYTLTTDGALTESAVTVGDGEPVLTVGLVVVQTAIDVRGYRTAGPPTNASVSADIIGIVYDSIDASPSLPGAPLKHIAQGVDPVIRMEGKISVYAEDIAAPDGAVWVRHTAATGFLVGAVASADGGSHFLWTNATYRDTNTSPGSSQIIRIQGPT